MQIENTDIYAWTQNPGKDFLKAIFDNKLFVSFTYYYKVYFNHQRPAFVNQAQNRFSQVALSNLLAPREQSDNLN